MNDILRNKSLDEVDKLFQGGYISLEDAQEYVAEWNKGPHFTEAVIRGGEIRNYLRSECF